MISNYKSGSFDENSVAELIYQSNTNIEPIVEYIDEHRQLFEYEKTKNLATSRIYYSLNLVARITSDGKSICWTYSLVITLNPYSVSKLFCLTPRHPPITNG